MTTKDEHPEVADIKKGVRLLSEAKAHLSAAGATEAARKAGVALTEAKSAQDAILGHHQKNGWKGSRS